jgi:hypothetical protein
VAKYVGDELKKSLPSLELLKKKFSPDLKQYKGKVLVVLNTTQHDKHNYLDARACTLLNKEDFDWWMNHDEAEFFIGNEWESFFHVLEFAVEQPTEIHRLLSIEELVWDNHKLKKVLVKAKQEYIDEHSSQEEEDKEEETPNKKRKL